jgi:hypothetical protein
MDFSIRYPLIERSKFLSLVYEFIPNEHENRNKLTNLTYYKMTEQR